MPKPDTALPASARAQKRHWCGTQNNPEKKIDPTKFRNPPTYFIYQLEQGDNGTRHYQWYAYWAEPVRFSYLKGEAELAGSHIEFCRGTPEQNIAYCSKIESRIEGPWEFGTRPPTGPGNRSDLERVHDAIVQGQTLRQIISENATAAYKYINNIRQIRAIMATPRGTEKSDIPVVLVFYGPSGCGKSTFASRLAQTLSETGAFYNLPHPKGSGTYWDGYEPGLPVVINEMNGNFFAPTFFNALCDNGPFQVPIHGGFSNFNSKYIIITTNFAPRRWWKKGVKAATLRRVICFPVFRNLSAIPQCQVPRLVGDQFVHVKEIHPDYKYAHWFHNERPKGVPKPAGF